ncbi:ParB N-terminal domain-containing protein [Nguyenibacter vanlangensis]|uniref:ParB N-terminal domain-containing protein n=1 Tax=Nguyenibacter vanlangensis TaxID=1216886 RepID=A0ABZ3D1P0_9PROT
MTETFNSLLAKGVFKKNKLYTIRLADLRVEPGFNLRDPADVQSPAIDPLVNFILAGGSLPPLEVRVDPDGTVYIVDGHRRHAAYSIAATAGHPVEWVDTIPFRGNTIDATARIIECASGEPLTPLQKAFGYHRMEQAGLSANDIAIRFSVTRQSVDGLLLLAKAEPGIHDLVRAGTVSAAIAADVIRTHGDKALAYLTGQVERATSQGKKKVTASTMGKALPRRLTETLAAVTENFCASLPQDVAEVILSPADVAEEKTVPVKVSELAALLKAHAEIMEFKTKHQ